MIILLGIAFGGLGGGLIGCGTAYNNIWVSLLGGTVLFLLGIYLGCHKEAP